MKKTHILIAIALPIVLHTYGQNVGIGTNTPSARLHVSGDATIARFQSNSTSVTQIMFENPGGAVGYIGLNAGYFRIASAGDDNLRLGTAGGYPLVITTSNNIGINTTTPSERLEIGSGNIQLSLSAKGIILNAADRPLITRGFDEFTSGNYNGIGRWGLFMEPSRLTLGIPSLSGKAVEIAKYDLNSSRTTLLTVNEEGKMRRPASNNQDLLPIAMGNINYNGAIWGGSGNFTVEHPSAGNYYITFNGFAYDDHQYIVVATANQIINTLAFAYTTQVSSGRLGIIVRSPNGNGVDQDVHFVMYRIN